MPEKVGQQIGNYRLVQLLGEGGFADVYLGEHVHLPTKAALKFLKMHLSQHHREAFLREAEKLAGFRHIHIIRLLDYGIDTKDQDKPYLIMEYAPDGTLRDRHPRGTIVSLEVVVDYVNQIAAALQYAHDSKLIHRDLKPQNVLIGNNGELLLSDFGVAATAHRAESLRTGRLYAGTPVYSAPEQLEGYPSLASDQYSLAVMVYEWLSGYLPVTGNNVAEILRKHAEEVPQPLFELIPGIPPAVNNVVMHALSKKPEERFDSVKEFAARFEQAPKVELTGGLFLSQQPQPKVFTPPSGSVPSQAVPISLFPATQSAGDLSPQEASDSVSVEMKPTMDPSDVKAAPTESKKKVNGWEIGKRQVLAGIIGFAIVACLSTLVFTTLALGPSFPSLPTIVQNMLNIGLPIGLIFIVVSSEFFGAVFGPWVGLFSGAGLLVGYKIVLGPFPVLHYHVPINIWPIQLGIMLVGFITGFAMFKKKGRYNIGRTLSFSSLAAIVGSAFLGYSLIVADAFGPIIVTELINVGIIALAFIIAGLILLPILLVIYTRIANRRKSTSMTA